MKISKTEGKGNPVKDSYLPQDQIPLQNKPEISSQTLQLVQKIEQAEIEKEILTKIQGQIKKQFQISSNVQTNQGIFILKKNIAKRQIRKVVNFLSLCLTFWGQQQQTLKPHLSFDYHYLKKNYENNLFYKSQDLKLQTKEQYADTLWELLKNIQSTSICELTINETYHRDVLKELSQINFIRLLQIQLIKNEIDNLQPIVWLNIPELKSIQLSANNITNFKPLAKTRFKNLKTIELRANPASHQYVNFLQRTNIRKYEEAQSAQDLTSQNSKIIINKLVKIQKQTLLNNFVSCRQRETFSKRSHKIKIIRYLANQNLDLRYINSSNKTYATKTLFEACLQKNQLFRFSTQQEQTDKLENYINQSLESFNSVELETIKE